MRAVVQLVRSASVRVASNAGGEEELVSSIGRGMLVLVGLCRDDTLAEDGEYVVRRLLNMRLFEPADCSQASTSKAEPSQEDGGGASGRRWDKSAKELGLEILCVSQFTLHSYFKGNKLDFHRAMPAGEAEPLYSTMLAKLRADYGPAGGERVKDGRFGARMVVTLENDGPVTVLIDSKQRGG